MEKNKEFETNEAEKRQKERGKRNVTLFTRIADVTSQNYACLRP